MNPDEPKCNLQKQKLLSHDSSQDSEMIKRKSSDNSIGRIADLKLLNRVSLPLQFRRYDIYFRSMFFLYLHLQTYSGKDPKTEAIKAKNFIYRQHTPPIITTTAATPQDSPNTTLEAGTSFKHWDSLDLQALDKVNKKLLPHNVTTTKITKITLVQQSDSIPSLLKLPSLSASFRLLNKNDDNLQAILSKESKSSIPQKLNGAIEKLCDTPKDSLSTVDASIGDATSQAAIQKKSSFKRFRRSSSKKKKGRSESDTEVVLNNGRDPSTATNKEPNNILQQLKKNENLIQTTTNRIRNDTKDTNKLSPQNSFRQSVAMRRNSAMINNSQQFAEHYGLQSVTTAKNHLNYRRRMSSIEQVYEKSSNIKLYNLENIKSSGESINAKIELASIQKSLIGDGELVGEAQLPEPVIQEGRFKRLLMYMWPEEFTEEREQYSLYIFAEDNR